MSTGTAGADGAGLRLSEGCALRQDHVDPRGYVRVLGKGGEEDIVPVEGSMVDPETGRPFIPRNEFSSSF